MDQATQRPRFRTDVAMGVLLAWGVCALLYLDVAARLEAGASDGLAAWLRAATRGGVISPLDAWASAMRRLACAVTLVSLPFVFPAMWRDRRALAARVVGESTKETVAFLRIVVATKADQPREAEIPSSCGAIDVSSQNGCGLADLRRAIAEHIERLYHRDSAVVAGTAVRCLDSLQAAAESLRRAREAASLELGEELVAAEIRIALDELGRVTGAVHTDDVLDRIFSRFCIGK